MKRFIDYWSYDDNFGHHFAWGALALVIFVVAAIIGVIFMVATAFASTPAATPTPCGGYDCRGTATPQPGQTAAPYTHECNLGWDEPCFPLPSPTP